ncbi:MAG: adenylate/guanylate cyclase domain-containing protein [Candidatus Methylomirabilia bacterium]
MVPWGVERKLTAILSADVKGYSRLMGEDEVATIRTLTAYREVMASLIQLHRGRVIDMPGDNLLAEFASVVDAVQCAVEIQQALKSWNAELPDRRKMEFRIGINLGDVVVEGERIYGDGVNIAARVEGLAEGGGVCISRTAFDQVKNKLALGYEFLGEHTVKNIAEPVRVYRVLMEPEAAGRVIGETRPPITRMVLADVRARPWRWAALAAGAVLALAGASGVIWSFYLRGPAPWTEVASEEKMAFPLPDKPSIAVLPFDNLSGDPKQDYLADGLTEDLITDLSRFRELFVIARNSTFTYKGRPVKVQQVAEDLGVRYILEGSVQRSADRVRITAQLVDAISGEHVWAERYDRDISDIFAVQDEVAEKIVGNLAGYHGKLTKAEKRRARKERTTDLKVYETYLLGIEYKHRFTKENNLIAQELLNKAIALDPEYARAYTALGWTYLFEVWWGWSDAPGQSLKQAFQAAQKAVLLDDSDAECHWLLADLYVVTRQFEKAVTEFNRALELNPNMADVLANWGAVMARLGRAEEGVETIKKAMRLNPNYPQWYPQFLGGAMYAARRYEEAVAVLKRVKQHVRTSRAYFAASYAQLGRIEEARAEVAETLKLDPNATVQIVSNIEYYKNPADRDHFEEGVRKAGLPD